MPNIISESTAVVYTCVTCGCLITDGVESHTVNGNCYCDHCFTKKFYRCCGCGAPVPLGYVTDYSYILPDGTEENYCESCFYEHYTCCDCCENIVPIEDIIETADHNYRWVCPSCVDRYFSECSHCGELSHNNYIMEDSDGMLLCEGCYNDRYLTCDDCGRFVPCGSAFFHHDEPHCGSCSEDHPDDESNVIREYHCNPPLNYYATLADNIDAARYYGIELEIDNAKDTCTVEEGRATCAEQLLNIMNPQSPEQYFFAMHDGSLTSYGLELISHPITRNYFDTHLATSTQQMFKRALELGYRGHNTNTCGLHFHVSRNSLSEDTIHNLILCMSQFWPTILTLSRRTESNLDRWAKRYTIESEWTLPEKKCAASNLAMCGDRYRCLNTTNRHTIELRIFRSTLKYSTFMACWDFFTFLIEWCESHTIEEISVTTTEQFIELMSAYTPTLKNYLTERGLI